MMLRCARRPALIVARVSNSPADGSADGAPSTANDAGLFDCQVKPIPDSLRKQLNLGAFYTKYADANGLMVTSSDKPVDKALSLACQLVLEMVGERDDVRLALIRNKVHFTMLGKVEKTTDPPEFSSLPDYYSTRARGLGGQTGMCAEESILCDRTDRWFGESICVHEFSHTISMYGLFSADKTFETRLTAAYRAALDKGLYKNTYASEQVQEYWAEGVQDWYNTNLESKPANGVHNEIDKKDELRAYDPALYALIDELLPDPVRWTDCYRD